MISLKKLYAIIAVVLVICLCGSIVLFGFIVDFSDGGLFRMETFRNCPRFTPYIYSQPTVNISMGYTPPANTTVLYCTYTITDSNNKIVDSSVMLHFPFSSEYIISKKLTNLANGNYTYIINAYYTNGTIRIPLNSTFTVDTTFIEPKLTVISPQNQTYNTNGVDIIYHINSKIIWSYYNLDDKDWNGTPFNGVPFNGNITLNGLSEGSHKLELCVKTEANEHSYYLNKGQTVYFSID